MNTTIEQQIVEGMAKAFFAMAWAEQCEESGNAGIMSGCDIMDIMPDDVDPAAIHAANTLAMDFLRVNYGPNNIDRVSLFDAYIYAKSLNRAGADRDLTPELFGHYLAMQAMSAGVGLESFGYAVRDAFVVPYVEFGPHSMEKDYFLKDVG